ncbi:MAG TPA: FKBP-type peptidyl-prolyl cis-trans isomerase [Pedobacter sp.]|nr:FKBP-type peptidyl-prolyl cis-trans isomerase [Pedobacter sp.]
MKKSLVILLAASTVLAACNKEQKGKGGLLYTVHHDAGATKIKEGDFIKIDFIQKNDKDSILDATYDHEQSRIFPVGKKVYAGDMNDVLTLFGEGDSVTFKLNIDTMVFYNKQPRPDQFKDQKYLNYTIKIQKVLSKKPNEVDSVYQKRANEFFTADYKASLDKKKAGEAAKMKKYAEDNNLKVTTTASGLQYVILAPGTGPKPVWGDTAVVDYTGKLTFKKMSGVDNVFDTSIKAIAEKTMTPNPMKQFAPTPIPLAENIAKGFVEALQLIGKGGKITVIMPSKLGYGEQGGGPIGPYSPLVFDIEIKNIIKGNPAAIAPSAPVAPAPAAQ